MFYWTNCAYNLQIGPVPAITEVLKKAGLSLKDMDLVEVRSLNVNGEVTPVLFSRNIPLVRVARHHKVGVSACLELTGPAWPLSI